MPARKKAAVKKTALKRATLIQPATGVKQQVPAGPTRKNTPLPVFANSFIKAAMSAKRPVFTGRQLVILNSGATLQQIQKGVKTASLNMATAQDYAGSAPSEMIRKAFAESDGIIFNRLKIAVVNDQKNDQVRKLTTSSVSSQNFLASEQERYVYALPVRPARVNRPASVFTDTGTATWGIQASNILNSSYTGAGVNIAILDTGFDLAHPDFAGRNIQSNSFVNGQTAQDGNGHGSHCTGIAAGDSDKATGTRYGVAKNANIFVGKVLADDGSGQDADILAGMEWALNNNCRIVSMSLGAPVNPGDAYSQAYETAARQMMASGCIVIAAAGNDSDRRQGIIKPVGHPANCPSIMAVAALDESLDVAWFSDAGIVSGGGQVDIAGPGVDIYSSWTNNDHQTESGTSMATPFVAGVAALLCEANPNASAGDIWSMLTRQARRLGGASSDVGSGLVFAL